MHFFVSGGKTKACFFGVWQMKENENFVGVDVKIQVLKKKCF